MHYYWVSGKTVDGVLFADSVKAPDRMTAMEEFCKEFKDEEFDELSAKLEDYVLCGQAQ